jgi:hypothetical protein
MTSATRSRSAPCWTGTAPASTCKPECCGSPRMGHVEPSDTYRYLTAAPELLALAAKRLEITLGELP